MKTSNFTRNLPILEAYSWAFEAVPSREGAQIWHKQANGSTSIMASQRFVIFDFDRSLVNDNSDTWIIEQLTPELVPKFREKYKEGMQWTNLMDFAMGMMADAGVDKGALLARLGKIPFYPEMKAAVRMLHKNGVKLYVLSDANTVFIDAILSTTGLSDCFSGVISNPAEFDEKGRLTIKHYHKHTCKRCPVNLCKGQVMEKLILPDRKKQQVLVAYVGDGGNDVCPARRLLKSDYILARKGLRLAKELAKNPPVATVCEWGDGKDALGIFEKIFGGSGTEAQTGTTEAKI